MLFLSYFIFYPRLCVPPQSIWLTDIHRNIHCIHVLKCSTCNIQLFKVPISKFSFSTGSDLFKLLYDQGIITQKWGLRISWSSCYVGFVPLIIFQSQTTMIFLWKIQRTMHMVIFITVIITFIINSPDYDMFQKIICLTCSLKRLQVTFPSLVFTE